MSKLLTTLSLILLLFSLFLHVVHCDQEKQALSPFTPKATLVRYWNTHISNHHSIPTFLLSKASPLSAVDTAVYSKLATQNRLSGNLTAFCAASNLFCEFDSQSQSLQDRRDHHGSPQKRDANFISYTNKKFTNYGGSTLGGVDSFKNYSNEVNMPVNMFTMYSSGSTGHGEGFNNYADNGNVADDTFTNYGAETTGGSGDFNNYESNVNVPNLKFTSYSTNGNNHKLSFGTYSDNTNSGTEVFTTYGRNGNDIPSEFNNYGHGSNIVGSTFTNYGELANAANDSFKGYAPNGNNPHNNFKNYGSKSSSGIETFQNYRNEANVGDDTFQSYIRDSSSTEASFDNYGKSFNEGHDSFKEYGKGGVNRKIEFKNYGVNSSFKGYDDKKGVMFSMYAQNGHTRNGKMVNKLVEEGKFFRESMLKSGNIMKMPDIKDKMPKRSFLPRAISSKLPFSTLSLMRLRDIFRASENSTLERVVINALAECEREPSPGETKRCVGSVEDMIDFAVSVLGRNVVVRATDNVNGSGRAVEIGPVRGINGGNATKSVSCHQSLYPYLLYYCHSVPKVRVYEADILDPKTKEKINHGVAICHLDTSAWSVGHGAFLALGSGPGRIEVCHWIFENDMSWAIAD